MDRLKLIKDVLESKLDTTKYLISTYYDLINSKDNIDRYFNENEYTQNLFYETNKENYNAIVIISMSDDGDISNLSNVVSYDFDFNISIQCLIDNKDAIIRDFDKIVKDLTLKDSDINSEYSIQLSFSNPNIEIPDIVNDKEMLSINIGGSSTITPISVVTNKDILDVEISIVNKDLSNDTYTTIIDYINVPVQSNLGNFSITPENIQTKDTGFYTKTLTYRAGISNLLELRLDLENSVCKYLFLMTKLRKDNVNVYLKVKETIGNEENKITIETIKSIERIDTAITNNGILYLSLSLITQETLSSLNVI